jgi:hypothetical protein
MVCLSLDVTVASENREMVLMHAISTPMDTLSIARSRENKLITP